MKKYDIVFLLLTDIPISRHFKKPVFTHCNLQICNF